MIIIIIIQRQFFSVATASTSSWELIPRPSRAFPGLNHSYHIYVTSFWEPTRNSPLISFINVILYVIVYFLGHAHVFIRPGHHFFNITSMSSIPVSFIPVSFNAYPLSDGHTLAHTLTLSLVPFLVLAAGMSFTTTLQCGVGAEY